MCIRDRPSIKVLPEAKRLVGSAGGRFLQHPLEILPGVGGGTLCHLLGGAGDDDIAAAVAALGAEVDDVVGSLEMCIRDRGGAVSVRLERVGGWLRLAVDNDGPSLTTRELAHLFEPFYRGDAARSRTTGGTGLGLAIVRTAAAAHGGTCWAENRAGGVRIWMELPALQSV